MRIKHLFFLLLLFVGGVSFGQSWNNIPGKTSFPDSTRYLKYRHPDNLDSALTIHPVTGNFVFIAMNRGGGGYGVDSITVNIAQGLICAWVNSNPTCYPLGKYFDSAALNIDSTYIKFFNVGNLVDSVWLPQTPIFAGTNMVIRDTIVTVNGNPVVGKIFDASGGGASAGVDSVSASSDSAYLVVKYAGGSKDSIPFYGNAGTVTNVTASAPLSITGASTVAPNVVADTTSGVASALVTQYQRKKTSDSLLALIVLKLNITDTTNKWVQFAGINLSGDSLYVVKNGVRTASKIAGSALDSLNWSVLDSLSTPPVSPSTGDIYEVGTSPTGAFVGHSAQIATWGGASWTFQTAVVGDLLYNAANLITSRFNGTIWVRVNQQALIHQGGEVSAYGTVVIGTKAANNLSWITNSISRASILSTGEFRIINLTAGGFVKATAGTGGLTVGSAVDSIWRTAGQDSIKFSINGRLRSIKDSTGGASVTPGGSNTFVQYNNSGAFGGDSTFTWANLGAAYYGKKYTGLRITPSVTAQANGDTLTAFIINNKYKANAKTGLLIYDMQIGANYFRFDSLYNYSIGVGDAARPTGGGLLAFGQFAGNGATASTNSVMIGQYAGYSVSNGANLVAIGPAAGFGSTNIHEGVVIGGNAGRNAPNATTIVAIGYTALQNATNASNAVAIGNGAGINATNASGGFFGGQNAGSSATGAANSIFIGPNTGANATSASNSIFLASNAGVNASGSSNAIFIGPNAGVNATTSPNGIFLGAAAGRGANSSGSILMGYQVGDSSQHKITGSNVHVIGYNITTPAAASTNMMDFGNVLYVNNIYSTNSATPSKTAQTTGQVGINVTTPDASSALDVTSTTAGVLFPRMTTTQKNAISSPAEGLVVYDLTLHKLCVYTGSAWETVTSL